MFRLVENRKWYFLLSALVIIPGLVAMIYSTITTGLPFKLAIDFTGGAIWELQFPQPVQPADLRQIFVDAGLQRHGCDHRGRRQDGCRFASSPLTRTRRSQLTETIKAEVRGDVGRVAVSARSGRPSARR